MNYFRAIRSGFVVWALLVISFATLQWIPGIRDSEQQQTIVIAILMICYAALGSSLYYSKGNSDHGLKLALIIFATALVLDALITVPFVEIPEGRGYVSFFTSPLLWMLVLINVVTVCLYWRLRISV